MAEGREFQCKGQRADGRVSGRERRTRSVGRSGAISVTNAQWGGAVQQYATLGGGHRPIGSTRGCTRDRARVDSGSGDRDRFRPSGGING